MAKEWESRILPYNLDAERSVLGSMMINKDAINVVSEILVGDDFYSKQHKLVYDAMIALNDKGQPVDPITLMNQLVEMDVSEKIVSTQFVKQLLNSVPTSVNAKYYANIVAEKAVLRRLILVLEKMTLTCYEQKEPLNSILETTEREVFKVVQKRNTEDFLPISTAVNRALDRISAAARNKGAITGIATGFTDLDYMTAGMQPSDLVLIAARPSMGKTAFALNIADYVAVKQKKKVAIFPLEMPKEQLLNRMFSLESHVNAQKLKVGDLNEADWECLIESAGMIGDSGLIIDDTNNITVKDIQSKCRKYKLEHGLDMVMIDYLQLITGAGKNNESRQNEVSEISRGLKAMARELKVPVIALSQLSRAGEKRDEKRPMLSDLRDSGAIEQDADMVMFLYREDYYDKTTVNKGVSEVIIAKQRNGPIGTVKLAWISELTKFANLERNNRKE